MFLKKESIKSKKTGKIYNGYKVQIGDFETPIFFPSKVESLYLDNYLEVNAHRDFKGDDLDVDSDK